MKLISFKSNGLAAFKAVSRHGFSLVEVVLAVGIMALGIVTILGLLPHGLEVTRKTANEQAESRIVDQIVGELQSADWATLGGVLSAGNSTRWMFDDQGLRVFNATEMSYIARALPATSGDENLIGANTPASSRTGTLMPSNAGNTRNPYLLRMLVQVAVSQTQNFDFDNPTGVQVKSFPCLVTKMRQ